MYEILVAGPWLHVLQPSLCGCSIRMFYSHHIVVVLLDIIVVVLIRVIVVVLLGVIQLVL